MSCGAWPWAPMAQAIHLADIAEARVAQRRIAEPERRKARVLGALRQLLLVAHRGLITLECFDWEEHAQRHPTWREHALKAPALIRPRRIVRH
jgi:hypothetical protein